VKRLSPLLLIFVVACAPAPRPVATPPAAEAAAATEFKPSAVARRVVLLSFDALGADQLAAQTGLPAFERAMNEGTTARIVPINPTATAPAHVAILTGTPAEKNGIVSNRFHLPGTPPEQMAGGMSNDPDAESIVEAARRQGKRVGCTPFPSLEGKSPRRTCDFGLAWVGALVRGRMMTLTRSDFHREWVPPTWSERPRRRNSFSPVMRARVEWSVPDKIRADVDVVAYDETDDQVENYDAIAVELDGAEVSIAPSGWFAVSKRGEQNLYGSWSKLLSVEPALAKVELYWGAIHRNEAWPAEFRAMVDDEMGFWPGGPDETAAPAPIQREQNDRLAAFLTRVQTTTIQRMPFDLLLIYQPEIDSASHQFLGENVDNVHAAWVAADRDLAAIRDSLDLTRDALVVTGDHGMAHVDTELHVGRLLADAGLAPRWRAYATGHLAHLYRFGEPDDTASVVKMLTDSGYFEKVEAKTAAMHRNAGDIVATSFTHIAMNASDKAPVTISPDYHGQHGGLNTHRELHTLFFATGAGVPRATLGEISQTKIARYVATLLGIQPPSSAE
jgi:predicted AlkP superfamily pyrophosphatase or phosphodiesterase